MTKNEDGSIDDLEVVYAGANPSNFSDTLMKAKSMTKEDVQLLLKCIDNYAYRITSTS